MALTFFYDFASSYSHLSVLRMDAVRGDVEVSWRPFLLGPIFAAAGLGATPNLSSAAKAAHMWRDLSRRSAVYGLPPFVTPAAFPQRSVAAARAALALPEAVRPAFTRAAFVAQFCDGRNIADPRTLEDAATSAGLDPAAVAAGAASPEAKAALFATTAAAEAAGVFGAPSFVAADGELFWGDDRLEDALAWERRLR